MKKYFGALTAFLFSSSMLFAEGEAAAPKDQSFWQTFIMIGIALVFFYFILWRPEQKKRKAMEQQRSAMKKGDRITAMGIVGTLSKIQENTIIVKMYDGSKIEILKGAITDVQPATEEEARKAEKEDSKRVDFTEKE